MSCINFSETLRASLFTDPFSSLLTDQLGRERHFSDVHIDDPDPDLEFTAAAAL